MCIIDKDMVYNRLKYIIEQIVNAEVKHLVEIIETIDCYIDYKDNNTNVWNYACTSKY
jgi:hypothetical protein